MADSWHLPVVKQEYVHKVLSKLKAGATEEQKDSALQQAFSRVTPSHDISDDSLTAIGMTVEKQSTLEDLHLSNNSLFPNSEYYYDVEGFQQSGVAGDPIPYNVGSDNLLTSMLLGCFIMAMVALSMSKKMLLRQAKMFFRPANERITIITETLNEVRFQIFLVIQTCLLLSIGYYIYTRAFVSDTFLINSQFQLIMIYLGVFAGYFIVKTLLYETVSWVFFDSKKNEQWEKTTLFLYSCEGAAFFPIVMLMVYFSFSVSAALICTFIIIIFVKILAFYKTFSIFFVRNGNLLQIFLYFCALEMMPLLILWGTLTYIGNILKVNF